ncbi:XRE family transcriptional regulator [Paenibacillus sp. FSL L8-0708]|uniref:XRE family transcriptional regulator n=1 Tax=Paenibacillus sp. FSL L8-0708 TaxID=2975311 RepID=UPI0030FCD302
MFGFGLGKRRTRLGKFLDNAGIDQEWLTNKTKLNRDTISGLCDGGLSINPRVATKQKVISALRKYGYNVKADDFWD